MTLLDLIRNLHKDGKVVRGYDIFTAKTRSDIRDVVYKPNGTVSSYTPSPEIPPDSLELGDDPQYIICRDAAEYLELTDIELKKARYPRLLVCLFNDRTRDFTERWKNHWWYELPPVELDWVEAVEEGAIPLISGSGLFYGFVYDANRRFGDNVGSYYVLKNDAGDRFAWTGDLSTHNIPDGLTILT